MKRSWSREDYRRLTKIRQTNAAKARLAGNQANERARRERQRRLEAERRSTEKTITAPEVFSLFENTDDSVKFLRVARNTAKKKRSLFLDLQYVTRLTPDAILALIALVSECGDILNVNIHGSVPIDAKIASVLADSGFFEHVEVSGKKPAAKKGLLRKELSEAEAIGSLAQELIHYATRKMYGSTQELPPVYQTLMELMGNTFEHAGKTGGSTSWWASVFVDDQAKVSHFTFLDQGVGIFGSRQVQGLQRVRKAFNLPDDPLLLKDMFEGKLESRTGLSYRGRGLPKVYQRVQMGDLRNFGVVTNHVRADLTRDIWERVIGEFPGTVFHWELHHDH